MCTCLPLNTEAIRLEGLQLSGWLAQGNPYAAEFTTQSAIQIEKPHVQARSGHYVYAIAVIWEYFCSHEVGLNSACDW
jgi:hypothetical protein